MLLFRPVRFHLSLLSILVYYRLVAVCVQAKPEQLSIAEWTRMHGLDPQDRYLTYSQNYMRLTNNMFQVKNVMAIGVRSNRSVLLLDFARRPPDHILDLKAMQDFMAPLKVFYLPVLLSSQWNATFAALGISMQLEGSRAQLVTDRCLSFNGHAELGSSKLWKFRYPPADLGKWKSLERYLKDSNSEPVAVLCDRASLWSVDETMAPIPVAARLRDESRRILAALRPFPENGFWHNHVGTTFPLQLQLIPIFSEENVLNSRRVSTLEISLGVHYRRTDIAQLGINVSTLIEELQQFVLHRNVRKIFIATDALGEEMLLLRQQLPANVAITCSPLSSLCTIPEEALLIEQGICAQTDYFLGSPMSTVTLNIHHMRVNLNGKKHRTSILTNKELVRGSWRPHIGLRELLGAEIRLFAQKQGWQY